MRRVINFFMLMIILTLGSVLMSCNKKEFGVTEQYNFNEAYQYLDDDNHVYVYVKYDELIKLLDSKGTYVIYFGGAWCPNCQAAVPFINKYAKELGIEKVINFDVRLDNLSKNMDIRKCNDPEQTKMWEKIIRTLNYSSGSNVLYDDMEVLGSDGKPISTMSVPTIIVYKDGKMLDSLTSEYFYNPEDKTLWDTYTFDGVDVTDKFINELKDLLNMAL